MKVLIVSPTPTHPTVAGNRARILALAEHLSSRGHEVHFFWVEMEHGDEAAMARFFDGRFQRAATFRAEHAWSQRWRRRLLRVLRRPSAYQWGIDDWFDDRLLERLRVLERRERFDAVMVEYVFLSRALAAWGPDTLKVIDTHDRFADRYQHYLAAGKRAEWFSTSEAEEGVGLSRADVVLAIQETEARCFRAQVREQTRVVTVGHLLATADAPHWRERPAAGLLASANWINVEAAQYLAESVLPLVRRARPDFELIVAGDVGAALADRPGLRKLGSVQRPLDAYADAALAVNPVRHGTGLNIKTVESLALGLALITTRAGARGLPAFADGAYVSVSDDDAASMAEAIVNLLRSPERRRDLSQRALTFAQRWNSEQCAVLDGVFPAEQQQSARPAEHAR